MDLSTPAAIFAVLWRLFVYTPDVVQYGVADDWRSHAEAVKRGERFKDDCDGFSLTAVDLLREARYSARVVIVRSPFTAAHTIAVYQERDGTEWALDNRYPAPRPLELALSGSRYKIAPK